MFRVEKRIENVCPLDSAEAINAVALVDVSGGGGKLLGGFTSQNT